MGWKQLLFLRIVKFAYFTTPWLLLQITLILNPWWKYLPSTNRTSTRSEPRVEGVGKHRLPEGSLGMLVKWGHFCLTL